MSAIPASARPRSPRAWRKRIVEGDVPEVLAKSHDLRARHGRAAGRHALSRRFRGAAEGGAERAGGQPGAILFIDEIHTVIGAGATCGGAMDASNLLKPALAQGTLRCIGSHHLQGIPQLLREGPRAGPPLPEDRRQRAVDRGRGQDPAGPEALLREAPQGPLHREAIKAAVELSAQLHQRPQAARQGDRRDRRGRRRADAAAREQAAQDRDR